LEFENQKRSGPFTHGWEDVIFLKEIFKIERGCDGMDWIHIRVQW
jgi:hypothetical protein